MNMLADRVDVVIGVDTHKHTHTAAVVTPTGGEIDNLEIPATGDGYAAVFDWARTHGSRRAWSIEGTASYGAGLARFLLERGEEVIEIERPHRTKRRMGAKTDPIDAVRAAREALAIDNLAQPRNGQERSALCVLLAVRGSGVDSSTGARRQLQDLIVTAPEPVRAKLRDKSPRTVITACERLRTPVNCDVQTRVTVTSLRSLAKRIRVIEAEVKGCEKEIISIVKDWRPDLLDLFGVGPIGAAVLLCAWSHSGRIRSEAAFAMLSGAAPIPASSGMTQRHRLNRFGDRQLNRVLHLIVQHRMQRDPATKAYVTRRIADGKTRPEIRRCLKRYVARQLFRQLENVAKMT